MAQEEFSENLEMKMKMLTDTWKYLNACLVTSGLPTPLPPRSDSTNNASKKTKPVAQHNPESENFYDLMQASLVLLVRRRAFALCESDVATTEEGAGDPPATKLPDKEAKDSREALKKFNYTLAREKICMDSPIYDGELALVRLVDAKRAGIMAALGRLHRRKTVSSYDSLPNIINFADCVALKGSDLVANRVLDAGKVIASEVANCWYVLPSARYERCDFCLGDSPLCLQPCKHCTLVMYCSANCRREAWNLYHRLECRVVGLSDGKLPEGMLGTLRGVCMTFGMFDYNYAAICAYFGLTVEHINPVPLLQQNWSEMPAREAFCAKLGPPTYRNLPEDTPTARSLAELHRLIYDGCKGMNLKVAKDGFLPFFVEWHHRLWKKATMNNVLESNDPGATPPTMLRPVSQGLYPLLQLFQHSCNPNVILINVEPNAKAAFVIRMVPEGEALTVGRTLFYNQNTTLRKAYLETNFSITCKCDACQYDYGQVSLRGYDPDSATVDQLAVLKKVVNEWGIVNPPHSPQFLDDQVRYYECLVAHYLERI